MGYRKAPSPALHPRRTLQDTATPLHIYVKNGTSTDFAIPCWYKIVEPPREAIPHNRDIHDHIGWPTPEHPDHSCQSWDFAHSCCSLDHGPTCRSHHCSHYVNLGSMIPIHLRKEGYEDVKVILGENDGITATGEIDSTEDWIVRLAFTSASEDATARDLTIPFTVVIDGHLLSDGIIHVIKGPI